MKQRSSKSLLLLLLFVVFALLTCSSQTQHVLFAPAPGSPFAAGAGAAQVAIADVDGDRRPDIIFAGRDAVGVLLADGQGGFRPSRNLPLTPPPHLLTAADFNGDGRVDVAVSSHDSNSVHVLLGRGNGDFAPAPGSPFVAFTQGKPHNHGLLAGDVNRDGHPDITFGHQENGSIAVLLGDGKGGFLPANGSPFRIGRGFYPHALADMDGDGQLDIVAPDIVGNIIVVARGDGKGGFSAPARPIAVRPRPYFVVVADFDRNGRPDIVATHDDISRVTVLLADSAGALVEGAPIEASDRVSHAVVGDFDRDGRADIAIATGEAAQVFLGDGKGGFRAAPKSPFASGRGAWDIAAADMNRDGKIDLVLPNFEDGTITVLLGR